MKKSNMDDLPLTHQQASRLVHLFAQSFDDCLEKGGNDNSTKPLNWHPTLYDIHQQVVHALTPVQVEAHYVPGHPSPPLQLTLLGIHEPIITEQHMAGLRAVQTEEAAPVNKHTL